jgi:hypothetical protein
MAILGLSLGATGLLAGILALIFGVLIIKYPKLLTNLIGAYLIITGLLTVAAAI